MTEIKDKLKGIAKYLDIKYNDNWFKHAWISKEDNIKLEYMWMCPDPIYAKHGESPQERAKNIENFLFSPDFKECLHRYGGQVINKSTFKKYFPKWISKIEDTKIKKEYLEIYKKIANKLNYSSSIAILTKSDKKSELVKLKDFVLFHEWIHILANKNNLRFSYPMKDNWKYNEGLVTYLQEFAENRLDNLEDGIKYWKKYKYQKQYYIYAIKFRDLLNNTRAPIERKEKIINLKNSLSK